MNIATAEQEDSIRGSRRSNGLCALVADADNKSRRFLSKMLGALGYEVVTVANGIAALRAYRVIGADLVVTGIFMPEMDGLELADLLGSQAPLLPIIMTATISTGHPRHQPIHGRAGGALIHESIHRDALCKAIEQASSF